MVLVGQEDRHELLATLRNVLMGHTEMHLELRVLEYGSEGDSGRQLLTHLMTSSAVKNPCGHEVKHVLFPLKR
jgi:hypothetical protein